MRSTCSLQLPGCCPSVYLPMMTPKECSGGACGGEGGNLELKWNDES